MKPKAIIVDIDGTLADFEHRRSLLLEDSKLGDFSRSQIAADSDPVYLWCQNMVKIYHNASYQIIFLTARGEKNYESTIRWLNKSIDGDISYILLMRPEGDARPDDLVKEDVYNKTIASEFEVEFALDDRDIVVNMWRDRVGIPCLQVQKGQY